MDFVSIGDFMNVFFFCTSGTRYNIRGLDDQGEVANFCETEQVIIFNGEVASYVQVSCMADQRIELCKELIWLLKKYSLDGKLCRSNRDFTRFFCDIMSYILIK